MKTEKKTIIIAEIGECWNGDIKQAKKLIQVAAEAGCDYAKFQTLDDTCINPNDPEKEWFKKITLKEKHLKLFKEECRKNNIKFLCSPENLRTAKILKEFGETEVKIASTCADDIDMIKYINDNFKTVFLSTGLAGLDEVNKVVNLLSKVKDLYIMHCISEYPTGPLLEKGGLKALDEKDVHLNMMLMLKKIFCQYKVGYSDHTSGILAPVVAVAAGAEVIEKHITLDRKTPVENFKSGKEYLGTDHILSLEPDELKEMVSQIRRVEKMFGEWKWERTEGEKILKDFLFSRFED